VGDTTVYYSPSPHCNSVAAKILTQKRQGKTISFGGSVRGENDTIGCGMKKIAVYPGSFDPITNGHLDIISRALEFVDELIIAILINPEKQPMFSVKERMELIQKVVPRNDRIRIDQFDGLLVEYANRKNARVILRGLRALSDFDYEYQMALMNRRLEPHIETVFMVPAEQYTYLSSRLVKEIASLGGAIKGLVPEEVEKKIRAKFQRTKGIKI
jgi:pantetheine-phosphate adenylyltransferase